MRQPILSERTGAGTNNQTPKSSLLQGAQSSISTLFSWEEGDATTALRGAILLLLIVAGFVVLKTIRDATFLSHYSARILPKYMAWNTVVSALFATALIYLYRHVSLRRLLQAGLVVFAVGTILTWDHLPGHISLKPTIFYLWVGIYGTIIPVQAWSLVSTQLSARQAKRTLGLIGSGGILGGVAGGLLARGFVNQWGVDSLYPCASLLIVFAAAICPGVSEGVTESTPPTISLAPADKQKVNYRYVILLIFIIITGNIVSTFLDFQFKAYTQQQVMGTANLARFLGSFYAYLGVASLAFQLFLTPFILRKIGITAGLVTMPVLLLVGSGVFLTRRSFGSMVTLRGSEELLRHSLDRSSFEIIQIALPAYFKIKLKSLVETVGARASELIACLILVFFFATGEVSVSVLTEWNMVLLIVWLLCALLVGSLEYPRLLREQLRREELDFETVKEALFSNEFYKLLPNILRNGHPQFVLNVLDLVQISKKNWLGHYLVSIQHTDPAIRLKTLQVLFSQKADLTSRVKKMLQDPDLRVRVEAVHYISIRAKSPENLLQNFLKTNERDLAVDAAMCGLRLRRGSQEDIAEVERVLAQAENQRHELALQELAHILEFVPATDLSIKIYKRLLSWSSTDVRKAALKSIAATKPQVLIPVLLRLTRVPAIKAEVHSCLASYGKLLVPYLDEIILNPGETIARRKLALKVAANTHGSTILESVLKIAADPNISLRFSAIKTLNQFRKKNIVPADHPALLPIIDREISSVETEMKRAFYFQPTPDGLLNNLIVQRIGWGMERAFRALGLVFPHDAIYESYLGWVSGDPRKRDAAIEVVERILSPELAARMLPLLENTVEAPELDGDEARKITMDSILSEGDPLLLSAALKELDEAEREKWLPYLRKQIQNSKNPVIQESLNWRPDMDKSNDPLTVIEKMENLSKMSIFTRLSPPELLLLGEASNEIPFKAGDVIFREGDPAQEMFCLIKGKINLLRNEELIDSVEPGKSFGTLGVLANKNRISSAVCELDSLCLRIPSDLFWEILEDYSTVCHGIIEVLAEQIENLTAKVVGMPTETPAMNP